MTIIDLDNPPPEAVPYVRLYEGVKAELMLTRHQLAQTLQIVDRQRELLAESIASSNRLLDTIESRNQDINADRARIDELRGQLEAAHVEIALWRALAERAEEQIH